MYELRVFSRLLVVTLGCAGVLVSGCTDWDAGSGGTVARLNLGPGATNAGQSGSDGQPGIVYVDAWQPGAWQPGAADAGQDGGRSTGLDAASFDAGNRTPDDGGGGGGDTANVSDVGVSVDGGPVSDGGAVFDGGAGFDGSPVSDNGPVSDSGSVADSGVVGDSGAVFDGGPASDGGVAFDGGPIFDSSPGFDSGPVSDSGVVVDSGPVLDIGPTTDAGPVADGTLVDVGVSDIGTTLDIGLDTTTTSGDTWPTWTPDWGGYGDVSFPDDVDVFGGVITSCFNLYTYAVTESCAFPDLSAACIDTAAQDGSYYSQYLFAPLQGCMKEKCVPKCQGDSDPKCVERCLGKACATPFFACLSQGETGTNTCPTTFACLSKYEDKLFSIANKCFANATSTAQNQLATFFACGAEPQTESCINHIAACFGPSGKLGCLQVIQCAETTCAKGDEVCGFECIGKGSPSAVAKLDALWDCSLKKCSDCQGPNGCGDACTNVQCKTEQTACVLDSGP